MDGPGDSLYDPGSALRGAVASASDQSDGGIGQNPEKNPTPTLRIFRSNFGNQWLMYGGIVGGTQDYKPAPMGSTSPAKCTWFRFYYRGMVVIGRDEVFGNWKVTVEGSGGLERVAYEVGKHIKPTLMVGEKTSGLHPVAITSVRIEVYKPKNQKGLEDEPEEWEG